MKIIRKKSCNQDKLHDVIFFSTMIISNRKYFLIVNRVEKDFIDLNQCLPSAV